MTGVRPAHGRSVHWSGTIGRALQSKQCLPAATPDLGCSTRRHEQRSPPALWNAESDSPESATNRVEQCSTRKQRDDACQEQCLDHRSLWRRQFIEPVVRIELLEHRFELPAETVELRQRLRLDVVRRNARQLEPVRTAIDISHAHQAQPAPCGTPTTGRVPALEPDLHLDVGHLALVPVGHFAVQPAPARARAAGARPSPLASLASPGHWHWQDRARILGALVEAGAGRSARPVRPANEDSICVRLPHRLGRRSP